MGRGSATLNQYLDQPTALLLTGLQNDYCASDGLKSRSGRELTDLNSALVACSTLLDAARRAGVLVLHVGEVSLEAGRSNSFAWMEHRTRTAEPDDLAAQHSRGQEFLPDFQPLLGELVVWRSRLSCLADTNATTLLRSNGIRTLVIAGVETHGSLLATAIDGNSHDYIVVVPRECTTASEPRLYSAAMTLLGYWASVANLADIRDAWELASQEGGDRHA